MRDSQSPNILAAAMALPAASATRGQPSQSAQDLLSTVVSAAVKSTVAALQSDTTGPSRRATADAAKAAAAAAVAAAGSKGGKEVKRLPDDKWCKWNSCHIDHPPETKFCYRHPATTQAQLEADNPKIAASARAIERFNASKKSNAEVRKICPPGTLVLYTVPAAAKPVKGAVPFDTQSQCTDSMDGMPGLPKDLFLTMPSAPAVPTAID